LCDPQTKIYLFYRVFIQGSIFHRRLANREKKKEEKRVVNMHN